MHDLIIASIFVAILLAPSTLASISRKSSEEEG
jgi:hypothetical protein